MQFMYNMGNQSSSSLNKINYEDVQFILNHSVEFILINTLSITEQDCLIQNTVDIQKEEEIINNYIRLSKKDVKIVIYGKNCNDDKIYTKYTQLNSLGFYNVYIYAGGLFEWLLLQDIYGDNEFPTTRRQINLLKYKPNKLFNSLIQYDYNYNVQD